MLRLFASTNIICASCARRSLIYQAYSTPTTNPRSNQNVDIVEMLKRSQAEEERNPYKNGYKIRAFATAIKVISALDRPLQTASEAMALRGVGPGILRRIADHLDSNSNNIPQPSLDALEEERKRRTELALQVVPGIGRIKARRLVEAGCNSVSDLLRPKYTSMLTRTQQIHLQYSESLKIPVTRAEVEAVANLIQAQIGTKFEVITAGDYRRGLSTSPLISIMLLHPHHTHIPMPTVFTTPRSIAAPSSPTSSPSSARPRRPRLIKSPFNKGRAPLTAAARASSALHTDALAILRKRGTVIETLSEGEEKWVGIVKVPNLDPDRPGRERFVRVDMHFVPQKSRGAALLALTGDAGFVRHVRLATERLGMYLDEFGLWKWVSVTEASKSPSRRVNSTASTSADESDGNDELEDSNSEKSSTERDKASGYWALAQATTEQEILRELGIDWVEPERRNWGFVINPTISPGRAAAVGKAS